MKPKKTTAFSVAVLLLLASGAISQGRLSPHTITLKKGDSLKLNLPADYEMIPAAEGLKRVRFFAKAPDGRIFVTDMYNLADNTRGTVYILDGFDEVSGKFAKVHTYMTGLRNPNSVQFHTDASGQSWCYLAETHQLTRRKFRSGETTPGDPAPQVLATFPDYGLSYKYGGWHLTRTIAFSPGGKLYVSVGSSCNSCIEKEKLRATVIEMNPDGSGKREYARGLRNAVSIKWIGNFLWATNQGSDHLGLNRPDETFYSLKRGADYGWPQCHSAGGRIIGDTVLKSPDGCKSVLRPYAIFPAHTSALGFDYFDDPDAPASIQNSFLVALHGSTDKRVAKGYRVVIMRRGERLQDLINGFLQGGKVIGRPCDIMKLDANSFLLSDDHAGVVYLVRKKGSSQSFGVTQHQTTGAVSAENVSLLKWADFGPYLPDSLKSLD